MSDCKINIHQAPIVNEIGFGKQILSSGHGSNFARKWFWKMNCKKIHNSNKNGILKKKKVKTFM